MQKSPVVLLSRLRHQVCDICAKEFFDESGGAHWYNKSFCSLDCLADFRKSLGEKCVACSLEIEAGGRAFLLQSENKCLLFCSVACTEAHQESNKLCSFCFAPDSRFWNDQNKHCSFECFRFINRISGAGMQRKCFCCTARQNVEEFIWLCGVSFYYVCSSECLTKFKSEHGPLKKCTYCRLNFPVDYTESVTLIRSGRKLNFCCKQCTQCFVVNDEVRAVCDTCAVEGRLWEMIKRGAEGLYCSVECARGSDACLTVEHMDLEGKKGILRFNIRSSVKRIRDRDRSRAGYQRQRGRTSGS